MTNIIVTTFNRLDYTVKCLNYLFQNTDKTDYHLTVIDNNSNDGTKEYLTGLKANDKIDTLHLLNENVGVARAVNLGINPDAEYNIKLDNDIVIQSKNWLKGLIEVCEKIDNVGLVAYNFETEYYDITSESGIVIAEKNGGNLGGALLCIPNNTFEMIGYFCEDYGLYGEEDTDYSIRVRAAGLRTIYCANQNIGLHLPDGRAAKINDVTKLTENTKENEMESVYRNWKNTERQKNLSNGIYHNNIIGYEFGLKSLYYESKFVQSYINNSDVFIIIPFYNQIEMTVNCVESILKWTPESSYEKIVLVDDGSTENTEPINKLMEKYSGIIDIVEYNENKGYAYANNKAIKHIGYCHYNENAYLLFLNNDTIVTQNWLQNMIEVIKDDYSIGAVGSKLLFKDNKIQHAGVYIAKDMKYGYDIVARHIYYKFNKDYPPANVTKSYKALTGACLLMRKNVFQKLGGFDEKYYNGNEDIDLCFKLITSGFKLIYEPSSVVYHLESQTKEKRWLKTKENMILLQKWSKIIKPDYLITKDGKTSNYNATDIVIVVWDQLSYTKETIESIYKHTENFRLIIVNNNSDVETTQYIDELNKRNEVTVIHNNQNVGYTKAVNQGLSLTHGDVVLANNDIIVSKDWLTTLRSHVTDNVGIVSGVTNYASGLQQIPNLPKLDVNELERYAEFRQKAYKGYYVSFPRVIFFCTYITRKCLNEVGILDEIFSPGNYEDDDFCRRAELLGFDTRIAMDLFVYHFGSVSFKSDDNYRKLLETNEAKFIQKHGGTPNDLWGAKFNELKGKLK